MKGTYRQRLGVILFVIFGLIAGGLSHASMVGVGMTSAPPVEMQGHAEHCDGMKSAADAEPAADTHHNSCPAGFCTCLCAHTPAFSGHGLSSPPSFVPVALVGELALRAYFPTPAESLFRPPIFAAHRS